MTERRRLLAPLLLIVSSILAIVANSLLLLVFFKRRGLRTVSNRFVINLLATNLLSGIILIPLLILNETVSGESNEPNDFNSNGKKVLIATKFYDNVSLEISIYESENSGFLCCFSQIVTNVICVASIFGILLIAFDQYVAVLHPLRYHAFINKSKSLLLLFSVWSFSLVISFVDLFIFDDRIWKSCQLKTPFTFNWWGIVFGYFYFAIIFLTPFIIICWVYVKICCAAHQNSVRMRKSLSNNQLIKKETNLKSKSDHLPRVHSAPNIPDLNRKETKITRSISDRAATNLIFTLKTKISNASVFIKYREETRTAKISILVIFMVLICYFPYGITIINNNNNNLNFISIVLLILSNIISPFLFAYRSKRVQRELIKVFFPKHKLKNRAKKENGNNDNDKKRLLSVMIPKVVVTSNGGNSADIAKGIVNLNWNFQNSSKFQNSNDSIDNRFLEPRCSISSSSGCSTLTSTIEE